jgi:hypothetical protein
MLKKLAIVVCLLAVVTLTGCESRTDRSDGGVILSITDFDGLPVRVLVNDAGGIVQLDSITLTSVPKNPNAGTSELMNVEMSSYQVTYTRVDAGAVTPPPLVQAVFGITPVGGSNVYDNLPIMGAEQFDNPPLRDLLFANGGIDPETGEQFIRIRFAIQFFGRSLTGDAVASNTASFVIEFVP